MVGLNQVLHLTYDQLTRNFHVDVDVSDEEEDIVKTTMTEQMHQCCDPDDLDPRSGNRFVEYLVSGPSYSAALQTLVTYKPRWAPR